MERSLARFLQLSVYSFSFKLTKFSIFGPCFDLFYVPNSSACVRVRPEFMKTYTFHAQFGTWIHVQDLDLPQIRTGRNRQEWGLNPVHTGLVYAVLSSESMHHRLLLSALSMVIMLHKQAISSP